MIFLPNQFNTYARHGNNDRSLRGEYLGEDWSEYGGEYRGGGLRGAVWIMSTKA